MVLQGQRGAPRGALLIIAALSLTGCASTDPRPAIRAASQLAEERSGLAVRRLADDGAREAAARRSQELLAAPLNGDSAAELSLLNNPSLQARLEDLGIAQADLDMALIGKPSLGMPAGPAIAAEPGGAAH